MRDEVYAFFIRWVYDTGDKSASFHIPGRVATPADLTTVAGPNAQPDIDDGITPLNWRVNNTASITAFPGTTLPDGGVVIAEGDMGYWESTEIYDDDRPEVWNASSNPIWGSSAPEHDLCGKPIRHHRFPVVRNPDTASLGCYAGNVQMAGFWRYITRILGIRTEH